MNPSEFRAFSTTQIFRSENNRVLENKRINTIQNGNQVTTYVADLNTPDGIHKWTRVARRPPVILPGVPESQSEEETDSSESDSSDSDSDTPEKAYKGKRLMLLLDKLHKKQNLD